MSQQNFYVIVLILHLMTLTGCSSILSHSASNPRQQAEQIATVAELKQSLVTTKPFVLTTYQKLTAPHQPLIVYIEGDGHSWISRHKVSPDPTPHNPLALKLAALDPAPNVVYLARPCQYTSHNLDTACHPDVWTSHRFSEPVIAAMNEAVEKLKTSAQSSQIQLVGFSGGAAIAVLVAARRNDVVSLKTVAGDLDHEMMTLYHKTTPLTDALNPRHFAHKIAHISQHHYIGEEDKTVPASISEPFLQIVAKTHPENAHKTILPNVSHHKGWEKLWPGLMRHSHEEGRGKLSPKLIRHSRVGGNPDKKLHTTTTMEH